MSDACTIETSDVSATISPFGARLETLVLGGRHGCVLHADPAVHPGWHDTYAGAIVGPVANRLRAGRLVIDGQPYQMPCNENGNTLHSGPAGTDRQMWTVTCHHPARLCLRLCLGDGQLGLPGNRTVEAEYSVHGSTLRVDIWMTTDRATPAAFAHHPYWRLGDASAHRLQVEAAHYLPVDALNLPTGAICPVAGTAFDHRTAKPPDPGIDHNFCIARARRHTPTRVATLTGAHGLRLDIDSTEPGLQVYAGAFLPTVPGTDIKPLAGVALEPQAWPDAFTHPGFATALCTPHRPYHQITCYRLHNAT